MTIKKIGIIGAGTMGHGIALVSAKAGYDVLLHDIKEDYIKKGIASVERFIDKSVEKGKMTAEDKTHIMSRIHGTTALEDMKDADLVIEAILEQVALKKRALPETRPHLQKKKPCLPQTPPRSPSRISLAPQNDQIGSSACIS